MPARRSRPVFLTLWQIHFPWSALASITHRLSGLFMALSIPILISLFAASLHSQYFFDQITAQFQQLSLLLLFCWFFGLALIYHSYAGIRHLLMDMNFLKSKVWAQCSAQIVFGLFAVKGVLFTIWLWG